MKRTSTRTCHCQHRQGVGVSGSSFFAISDPPLAPSSRRTGVPGCAAGRLTVTCRGRPTRLRQTGCFFETLPRRDRRLALHAAAQPRGRAVRARKWRSRQAKGIDRDAERPMQIASGHEHSSRRMDRSARRVFCTDCKSKRAIVAKYVSLQRAPHALDIARILRALSRMRAEPVGESSLTILEFNLWINQTPIQLVEPRGIPLQHLARTSSTR